jgi:predicted O-methyltransferase YrrM
VTRARPRVATAGAATTRTEFDAVAAAVAGVPFMSPEQGRVVFDHVRATQPRDVLELGTAHGVGAAYLAAALPAGGRLTTVDFAGAAYDPSPEAVLARAGVADRVDLVRAYSTYTWWLKEQVQARSDAAGNCEPAFDFVYLDGSKNWTVDGFAVVLVEKLLRPGGWLLMDDLEWSYSDHPDRNWVNGVDTRKLSEPERSQPHLRAVFELIVSQHPSFTELRVQDEWWGWARKAPGEPRRLTIETSRSLPAAAGAVARRAYRAARRRAQARRSTR